MAKNKVTRDPSDCVHDTFRKVNAGVVDVEANSKDGESDYYVDRSQLQRTMKYDAKKDKFVDGEPVSVLQAARRGMGGLKFPSSNKRG